MVSQCSGILQATSHFWNKQWVNVFKRKNKKETFHSTVLLDTPEFLTGKS